MRAGDLVDAMLPEPGGARITRYAGPVRCIVLNAGEHECDLIVSPAEYADDFDKRCELDDLLMDAGLEDGITGIQEGPVLVLRNCNTEWVTPA